MGNFIEEQQQLQIERNKVLKENQRLFGYFKCNKCNKVWSSAYSWLNKWQQCKTNILPHKQTKLEKSKQIKSLKPHNMIGCQKCIELGRACG